MKLDTVTFKENIAVVFTGGGIFWENIKLIDKGIDYIDNFANNGPNAASNPLKVKLVTARRLEGQILEIPSGQKPNTTLELEILDAYD